MENTRTFDQAFRLLEICREKDPSREQIQQVFDSGLLGDVLDANLDEFTPEKREVIRYLLGLKSLQCDKQAGELRVILPIDRSKLFNPAEFVGAGWSIWRGPADGKGLEGDEERDQRATTLTGVNLAEVQLVTCLRLGETVTTGEERLNRLKTDGRIRLDENAFKAFWENQALIPARFKERVNRNIQYIFFDGVVLRSPNGNRYTLYLYFNNDGSWNWNYNWLDNDRNADNPSAVLATIFISSPLCYLTRQGSFVFQADRSNPRGFYQFLRALLI